MNWRDGIKVTLLLAVAAFCLFEFMLHHQSDIFREYEAAFLSLEWMLLACLAVWGGTFLFLTFSMTDLPLIGLLLIAIAAYCIGQAARPATDALTLLFGVTLGKGARLLLKEEGRMKNEEVQSALAIVNRKSAIVNFLVGLVLLLALSAWWHLDMSANFYHGPRWMGLWNNPNIYGMLMGAGLVLAIGLLAGNAEVRMKNEEKKSESGRRNVEYFAFFAFWCGHYTRLPFYGCGNDGGGVDLQLQPGFVAGGGRRAALSRMVLRQIKMAVCAAGNGCHCGGGFLLLERHAGCCAVVCQAHGFGPALGATPRQRVAGRLGNDAGPSVWCGLK
jgi:hypothetical protein